MKRALIIDDEPLARMVVREYLQEFPQINVLQECNDGFEGLKAIQQHQPDLVFLDVKTNRQIVDISVCLPLKSFVRPSATSRLK